VQGACVGRKRTELALRPDGEGEPGGTPADDRLDGDRSRVLEQPVQLQPGRDDQETLFALLVLRELVMWSSGDSVSLAIGAAGSRMGLSKEVQEKYIRNVLKHAGKGWPKGFM
jgi:hypothetical protein